MEQQMISINRAVASILPFVYALYLPVQSMFLPGFTSRYLEIIALVIYFYCSAATLIFFRGLQLPRCSNCNRGQTASQISSYRSCSSHRCIDS
jgi:hypothetical protein